MSCFWRSYPWGTDSVPLPLFSHDWLMVEVWFFHQWYTHLVWTKWEKTCWCHHFVAEIIKNWRYLPKFPFFWIFFSFKSFYCIFFYYILRSPKTPRLIRFKMIRLCNQEDNGAISKIKKNWTSDSTNVYKWLYLIWTKSSQSLFFISPSNQLFFRAPVNSCFQVLIFEWQRSELVHFLVKLQAEGLQLITANKCLHRSFSRKLSKF